MLGRSYAAVSETVQQPLKNLLMNPKFISNPSVMTGKQLSHPVSTCECRSVVRCFVIEWFYDSQCSCYSCVHKNASCLCDEHSPLLLKLVLIILVIVIVGIHDQDKI
jgi:hypothetical protein